jgi:hypothetical protein
MASLIKSFLREAIPIALPSRQRRLTDAPKARVRHDWIQNPFLLTEKSVDGGSVLSAGMTGLLEGAPMPSPRA